MNTSLSLNHISSICLILITLVFYGCNEDDSDKTLNPAPPVVASSCHNFTKQVVPYDTLTGGINIITTKYDSLYKIDLGFDFLICDSAYRNIYLSGRVFSLSYLNENPSLLFESDITDYRVSPFAYLNLDNKANGNQILSKIVVLTEGETDKKITSIEFRNYDFGDANTSELYDVNCKVIFNQLDNSISYHYGKTNTRYDFQNDYRQFLVGLFYPNSSQGIFLNGDPSSPSIINTTIGTQLTKWPEEGTYYTFKLK